MLSVFMLSVLMLNMCMLSCIMVSVFEPGVFTLTAIPPSVVLLNGAAPIHRMAFEKNFEQ